MSETDGRKKAPASMRKTGLQRRISDLEQERDDARASAMAKAALLATVSHELRTPIGAIISMTDLLLDTDLDTGQRGYAETLRQSATGLLIVLNDILDHSKLEAGQFDLVDTRFDPRELLASVKAAMTARAAGKPLEIIAGAEAAVSRHLVGDPDRLRQILMNIADNAVKFTESGTVSLRMSERRSGSGTIMLDFEVRDTGIGIPDDMKARLFLPYSQSRHTPSGRYGGTGLGLSIARKLVELMGGSIECESNPGEGSTFRFSVRCTAVEPDSREPRATVLGVQERDGGAHILVVEDNKINQKLITTYLGKFGHSFEVAANGFDAIEMAQKSRFDLILMDVQMPDMDGTEATRAIRALGGAHRTVPIVALTANAMHGDRERYLAAGMNDYLAKPIVTANLLDTLERALAPEAAATTRSG